MPCKKPLTINSDVWTAINCFFSIRLFSNREESLLAKIEAAENSPKDRWDSSEDGRNSSEDGWVKNIKHHLLATFPAYLRQASFTLLLGEEEDSNLRIVFYGGDNPPEIKYLNFTWNDFLSASKLDFSTRLFTLPD